MALAVESANPAQMEVLALVGRPGLGGGDVERVQQAIVDTGALVALERRILDLAGQACAAISHAPIAEAARDPLLELVGYVSQRRT